MKFSKLQLRIIILNPLIGTGGGSFPIIYEIQTGFWKGHTHNIFSDLSLSYGLPSMIILIFVFLSIISNAYMKTFLRKKPFSNIIDRAWVSAIIIFLISQLIDVQYYDKNKFNVLDITIWR